MKYAVQKPLEELKQLIEGVEHVHPDVRAVLKDGAGIEPLLADKLVKCALKIYLANEGIDYERL